MARRAADAGDDGTNDLIVSEVVRANELQVWFIGEHVYMDLRRYKRRLIELEATLSNLATREVTSRREQLIDTAADAGDASVADESESEDFTEAELDTTVLRQVRDALRRIENGTYGQCLIDGGPIDPKRLAAVPWAPGLLIASGTISCSRRLRNRHHHSSRRVEHLPRGPA